MVKYTFATLDQWTKKTERRIDAVLKDATQSVVAVAQLIENPNNDVRAEDKKGKWDSTGDAKTRPTHAAANGQVVAYGEPFIVGGYSMLHPLDSSLGAPAEEIVQCRCYEEIIIDYFARLT